MKFHITYRRGGTTDVGRVNAPDRAAAIRAAAVKFNVPRSNITSVVGLPEPRVAPIARQECNGCRGKGKVSGPYGEPVRCRRCGGGGTVA